MLKHAPESALISNSSISKEIHDSQKRVSKYEPVKDSRAIDYTTTSFEERMAIVDEFLKSNPYMSDKDIAETLNSTEEFVKRQRKFLESLGRLHYPEIKPERVVEPITTPEMLEAEQKQREDRRRGKPKTRQDIWDLQNVIIEDYIENPDIAYLADKYKCSDPLIRDVLGDVYDNRQARGREDVWEAKGDIRTAYHVGKISMRKIAAHYKCSPSLIRRIILEEVEE